ncbi:MAG TPA: acyl-CoA thioesterase [Candidatus Limivivens merdigallinarum]|uniref:Acyl-CoA thioesterase n=1 Tax=Candidatus Limivivens merdigallinarum TaxID=2840859 RepID=A0A9D0ZWT4_9FIRM|nr:acyl-CoA thioesterase [Candidatus Limivivens merdigallinarum]
MNEIKPYRHTVQYYETDRMGIVHHSNYIRWFEEARVDILNQTSITYDAMEAAGVLIPVLEAHASYKTMTRFGDSVMIRTTVKQYNGVVLTMEYEVTDEKTNEVRCVGGTKHCFLNPEGKVLSLKHSHKEIHAVLKELAEAAGLPEKESGQR